MSDPGSLGDLPSLAQPVTTAGTLLLVVVAFLRGWIVSGAAHEARIEDWRGYAERTEARAAQLEEELRQVAGTLARLAEAVAQLESDRRRR